MTPDNEGLYWVRFDQGRARDIFGPDFDNVPGVEYRDDGACVAWWGGIFWTILGHALKIPPDAIREVDSLIYSAENPAENHNFKPGPWIMTFSNRPVQVCSACNGLPDAPKHRI